MKITNPKNPVLSALFVMGIVLMFSLVYMDFFSSNEVQLSFNYVVEEDEICSGIAHTFGVSTVSIIKLNNLKSDCSDISPGQTLLIPYPTPTITPRGFIPVSSTSFIYVECDRILYTVEAGDTLERISRNYAVSVKAIVDYNGILNEKTALIPGGKLLIPLCSQTPVYDDPTATYSPVPISDFVLACREVILTVLSGDTLDSISLNYTIPKEHIIQYNRLKSNEISPGMILLIPMCIPMPTPTVTPGK